MSLREGFRTVAQIVTPDTRDKFPVVDENDTLGGSHIYQTNTEMLSIPLERRRVGMHCFVIATSKLYRLVTEPGTDTTTLGDWKEIAELEAAVAAGLLSKADLNSILTQYAKVADLPDMSKYTPTNVLKQTYVSKSDLLRDYRTKSENDLLYADITKFTNLENKVAKTIVAIERPDVIEVEYGTAIADITALPKTINVTFASGTLASLPVLWDTDTYNEKLEGMQVINGDLTLPAGTLNAVVNVTQHIFVLPEVHIIDHFYTAMPINVSKPYGTAYADLEIPETVKVVYVDGTMATLDVDWTKAMNQYLDTDTNAQTLDGDLVLPDNVTNPNKLSPKVLVASRLKPQEIVKVMDEDPTQTYVGTSFEKLTLPSTVTVQMEDGTYVTTNVEWKPATYNPNNVGAQTVFGKIVLQDGMMNSNDFEAVITVNIWTYPDIYAAEDMTAITVGQGTKLSDISLPTNVKIYTVAYDGTLGEDVGNCKWNTDGVDISTPGTHTITGTIPIPPPEVTNKTNITIYQDIIVTANTSYVLTSVTNAGSTTVAYDTDLANITLPTTVDLYITGSDGSSKSQSVAVTWDTSSYDKTTAGTYTFTGTFTTPSGVQNTGKLTAQYTVTVSPAPVAKKRVLTSIVVNPNNATVTEGDDVSTIAFPATVQIYVRETDDSISGPTALAVVWDTKSYRSNSIGHQIIAGTINLDSDITNPSALSPQFEVTVNAAISSDPKTDATIIKINQPDDVKVDYGTSINDITLPTSVIITIQLPNGITYTESDPVTWNTALYSPTTPGVQVIEGSLVMEDEAIQNTYNLYPQFKVTVGAKPADPTITGFTAPTAINVDYGTNLKDITLPTTVEVSVKKSDGTTVTEKIPVTWDTSSYNVAQSGTYNFVGTLTIPAGYDSVGLTQPVLSVVMAAKPVSSVQYSFEKEVVLPKGTLTITPDMIAELADVTENDFYGYDANVHDGLDSRTFEVLYMGVVDDNGKDATIMPNGVRLPIETSDIADINRFVNDVKTFDSNNGTSIIYDVPGGESCTVSFDETTHTITFSAASATSNCKFVVRKTSDGSYVS